MKHALLAVLAAIVILITAVVAIRFAAEMHSRTFWYPDRPANQGSVRLSLQSPSPVFRARVVSTSTDLPAPAVRGSVPARPAAAARSPAPKTPRPSRDPVLVQPTSLTDLGKPALFRVMIDAGHIHREETDPADLPFEYVLTYKTACKLRDLLNADGNFYAEVDRGPDGYDRAVGRSVRKHRAEIAGILKVNNPNDRRFGWVPDSERKSWYGLRYYTLENGFDCLLSIHFDKVTSPSLRGTVSGFHVLVSPCNRDFNGSLDLGRTLIRAMQKSYALNDRFTYNDPKTFPAAVMNGVDPAGLKKEGLSVRSIVVLGDVYEYAYYTSREGGFPYRDIPSILIESGFTHEKRFSGDEGLQELAQRLYEGVKAWRLERVRTLESTRKNVP